MARIVLGSDHAGVRTKDHLVGRLAAAGHEVEDVGTHGTESVDYPDFARKVAIRVAEGRADLGILVCGTGLGVSIAANKVPGVRAAVCRSEYEARMARRHNDANVLCLGERVTGLGLAEATCDAFLAEGFEGGRHARRVEKIHAIEEELS